MHDGIRLLGKGVVVLGILRVHNPGVAAFLAAFDPSAYFKFVHVPCLIELKFLPDSILQDFAVQRPPSAVHYPPML